jgi:hypothetical protein
LNGAKRSKIDQIFSMGALTKGSTPLPNKAFDYNSFFGEPLEVPYVTDFVVPFDK